MQIIVEQTWSGGDRFGYRLTTKKGGYRLTTLYSDCWDRETASVARNVVQERTGCKRGSIKFIHQ